MVNANGRVVRACTEPVTHGMQIFTHDEPALEQRRQALSVLLTHHPLQCPVCPQSGRCELQSQVAAHAPVPVSSLANAAFGPAHPDPWLKRPELCVGCTRCVRFADEVLQQPLLALQEHPPRIVRLNQADPLGYTGSFADVCPVGVFSGARKPGEPPLWALQSRASICPGCATGCPVWLDESQQRIHKLRARGGRGFLCDDGYALAPDLAARVVVPLVNREPAAWDKALDHMAHLLQQAVEARTLGVVVSAELPSEGLAAVAKLARDVWGLKHVYWAKHGEGQGDAILRHPDKNPNTAGVALLLGPVARDVAHLPQDASAGVVNAVLVFGAERIDALERALNAAAPIGATVFVSSYDVPVHEKAEVVLPLATWAETHGSFVNHRGRSQGFAPARAPLGDALTVWEIAAHISSRLGCELGFDSLAQIRREMLAAGVAMPQSEPAEQGTQ